MLRFKLIQQRFPSYFVLATFFVLAIRLFLSRLPSFEIDMGTWLAWSLRLKDLGFSGFYSDSVWTQYTPGFLYWLWVVGKLNLVSEIAIKLPVILADIATGYLIWLQVGKFNKKFALPAFLIYTLNPVVVFNGSVWGQIDGIFTLFLFMSIFFVTYKKNILVSGILWAGAFLIKPQAFALLPFLILISFRKFSLKENIKAATVVLGLVFVASLPFFPNNPILGLPVLVNKMSIYYPYTSVFAFNIWSLVGMWKPDNTTFLGMQYFYLGLVLYIASLAFLFWKFGKKLNDTKVVYLVFALSWIAFFLFPTRVHERYIFPAFAFLITAAGLSKSKVLMVFYLILSFLSLANLYHPYAYYSQNSLRVEELLSLTGTFAPLVGIGILILFFAISFREKIPSWDKFKPFEKIRFRINMNEVGDSFPKLKISSGRIKIFLAVIIAFAFVTRVFSLGNPPQEYFDEIYHAFTARQMLHGNPKAWEWWNTPPTGFAYEWTHPPLAKEGMVLGMLVFGENSFGWRIPGAILGVGSVFLVYLIAREMFKDEIVGVLSSAVFALDGLPLVESRIGMNDSYFLFFALLSIFFFLRKKNLPSAFALGLSLASKWSALWVIPIIVVFHFVMKRKITPSYVWFFILPPLVYLATYIPLFTTGHNFGIFVEMQKQMWWYHTNLRATHPYTSAWWSWPLMLRPVWLYTTGESGGWLANIYTMGNPVVFWFGLASIATLTILGLKRKIKTLLLVAFSYLVFFVPWALSPRIMFLYHYLPSVPFLAIATGYVLRKYKDLVIPVLTVAFVVFIYFFPHLAGIKIPTMLDSSYYWLDSWR